MSEPATTDLVARLMDKFAPVFCRLTREQAAALLETDEACLADWLGQAVEQQVGAPALPADQGPPNLATLPPPEPGTTRLQLGNRVYDLVPALKPDELRVGGEELLRRGLAWHANATHDDVRWFREHGSDTPDAAKEFHLACTGDRPWNKAPLVRYLTWIGQRWSPNVYFIGNGWEGKTRLVRRIW